VDDYGRPVTGASWSVSDPSVAELSTSGAIILTGKTIGEITITAFYQSFSAQATATVYAGPELPQGAIRWSGQPAPGYSTISMVQAQPTENMPDIYSVEQGGSGNLIVRALTSDGRQLWRKAVNLSGAPPEGEMAAASATTTEATTQQWFVKGVGDTSGGLMLQTEDDYGVNSHILRFDGASGEVSWQYVSTGWLYWDWALHPDGTMFVGEIADPTYFLGGTPTPEAYEVDVLALDGTTGAVKSRVPLPPSYQANSTDCPYGYNDFVPFFSGLGAPMVAPNGSMYVEAATTTWVSEFHAPACAYADRQDSWDTTLLLLEMRADGSIQWRTLKQDHAEGNLYDVPPQTQYRVGEVLPDGGGGLLAAWSYKVWSSGSWVTEARMDRVTDSGQTEYTLPLWVDSGPNYWYLDVFYPPDRSMVLGEDGVAFATGEFWDGTAQNWATKVVAFGVGSGTLHWASDIPGRLDMVAATAGNGLVGKTLIAEPWVWDGPRRVVRLDANGAATYDDWTGGPPTLAASATSTSAVDPNTITGLQYAWGSQWIAIQQSPNPGIHPVAISAPAILWPWSIWSKPSEDDTRASIGPVKVNVFKILEASVDDTFIRAQVNFAIAYWQLNGRILLEWDGSIIPQLGCDPPQGIPDNCAAPYDVYDLTVTKGNKEDGRSPHEAVRRFQSPKGVTYLFVEGFADSATPLDANIALATHGITPLYVDAQGNSYYTNLSILRSENLGLVVPAHETGHQLQLFHVNPISGLANLMCGAVGSPLDWLAYLVPWDCSPTDSNELTHAQIDRARDAATALTGR
jgi:hypothetical protein